MKWAIKNIGLIVLALCICLAINSVENWTDALKQNTQQVSSAVTCHADDSHYAENRLAASLDASMLRRMNKRVK